MCRMSHLCSVVPFSLSGVDDAGRRQWLDGPPNTLLDALAQAELTSSTLDTVTAGQSSHTQLNYWSWMFTLTHLYSQTLSQSETEQRRKRRRTLMLRWTKSVWSRDQTTMTRRSTHWRICVLNSPRKLMTNNNLNVSGTLRSQRTSWEKRWQIPWRTCSSWMTWAQTRQKTLIRQMEWVLKTLHKSKHRWRIQEQAALQDPRGWFPLSQDSMNISPRAQASRRQITRLKPTHDCWDSELEHLSTSNLT